jgi:EAL domain-containing protein (putative c-di-GMP-specific phosphodiesterase class I)
VTMAHGLGLRVTAEGVENERQLAFLRDVACDAVQGYYFREPAPASELEVFLRRP